MSPGWSCPQQPSSCEQPAAGPFITGRVSGAGHQSGAEPRSRTPRPAVSLDPLGGVEAPLPSPPGGSTCGLWGGRWTHRHVWANVLTCTPAHAHVCACAYPCVWELWSLWSNCRFFSVLWSREGCPSHHHLPTQQEVCVGPACLCVLRPSGTPGLRWEEDPGSQGRPQGGAVALWGRWARRWGGALGRLCRGRG